MWMQIASRMASRKLRKSDGSTPCDVGASGTNPWAKKAADGRQHDGYSCCHQQSQSDVNQRFALKFTPIIPIVLIYDVIYSNCACYYTKMMSFIPIVLAGMPKDSKELE